MNPRLNLHSGQRGVALIIVLAVLVLIVALVVGFLFRAGRERSASASYAASSSARLLEDTAVNLVQAQINEATSTGLAWASQPGAIRVFDSSGNLKNIYRLYSASTLTAEITQANAGTVLANDLAPADWATQPALWVDLNAPLVISGTTAIDGTPVAPYSVYPVLDPRDPRDPGTVAVPKVSTLMPGFSIDSAKTPGATSAQPVPMPVRWLYLLQNGEVRAPTKTGSTVSISGASSSNPITGRIAFWTDDETSKVNINTAAGSFSERSGTVLPAPWDTPRFKIYDELKLFSQNQPVLGEYQRYPGHPATTDLYRVLDGLGISLASYPVQQSAAGASSPLFNLLPRYNDDNGSKGGSVNTTTTSTPLSISSGSDRLFSSLGEVYFSRTRNSQGISRQQLESGKFFLTAHSRAPETTLFGTPRVAMWPIHNLPGATTRTTFDNLIAFCSTVRGKPYYIQRSDSRSATNDYNNITRNKELYAYLKNLASSEIPGFGGKFSSKYSYTSSGTKEIDQILTEMVDYIRTTNLHDNSVPASNTTFKRFTDSPSTIPGYSFQGQVTPLKIVEGGSTTPGLGRIQTFSEIGIQIICTADGNSSRPYLPPVTSGAQKISPVVGSADDPLYASNLPEAQFLRKADGTIVDIDGNTVTSSTLASLAFPANPTLTTTGIHGDSLKELAPGQRKIQAMLLFEIACPTMGFDSFDLVGGSGRPAYKINVSGIQGIDISGNNPFPNRTSTTENSKLPNLNGNGFIDKMSTRIRVQATGGLMGFRYILGENGDRFNAWSGNNTYTGGTLPYRYVSNPFTVDATTLSLGGGFRAELHVPTPGGGSDVCQTVNVAFPAVANIPVPDLPKNALSGNKPNGTPFTANIPADWWGFDLRIARSNSDRSNGDLASPIHGPGAVIRADIPVTGTWSWKKAANVRIPTFANQASAPFSGSDVVRTLVARDGDYRLVAATETISADPLDPSSPFAKGPGYNDGVKLGHLFKDQDTSFGVAGVDNQGKLVAGAPYSWQITPKVPSTMDPAKQLTWDWDNGLPEEPDGAYANKPDEGNIYTGGGESPYYNREQQGSMTKIASYFTANRIVSSPVMFGSLPTGVMEKISWRTLLFRPQVNRPLDPSSGPKDHLLLDLFWMPVVEPYAISEPFSTAGKVNMNYQIVPFTYIKRSTALQSVLSSELIPRVPKAAAANLSSSDYHSYYKGKSGSAGSTPPGSVLVARLPLNLNETDGALRQFKTKFDNWEIFKSASEICDIYLTPTGYNWTGNAQADTAWYGNDFSLVGDNSRERPYANIYPRLTTKSNTFKVYYKVQVLKNPGKSQGTWEEGKGVVTGEYVGSTTLERYLDPNNPGIPDYATDPGAPGLDNFYQWRVVANDGFPP